MKTQTITCCCGEPLHLSVRRMIQGEMHKSCPECSRQAGRHIFRPLGDFGWREMDGETKIQSWCLECRKAAQSAEGSAVEAVVSATVDERQMPMFQETTP